jgi:hypothetical protein
MRFFGFIESIEFFECIALIEFVGLGDEKTYATQ